MEYLRKFDNHTQYEEARQNLIFPNVSLCVAENEVHYNPWTYAEAYLTFVAKEDGTFKLSTNAVSYSLDNGETWTPLAADTASPTVTAGNKIMWKGELTPSSSYGVGSFSATGDFDVQGNVMSLLYGDNFKGQTDLTGKNYAFYRLFNNNTKVVSVENLSLPATTLANHCYSGMFQGCTNLVNAPELPATTLADDCYGGMFQDCTSLTTAPELPATTLTSNCYEGMFYGCTGLTRAPSVLLATTLESSCYLYMFNGCTSLTNAPELPATTLAYNCYNGMFYGCTNLVNAPELPATTLVKRCYSNMFNGCSNLTTAPALPANALADRCYNQMFNGCTSLTYIKCLATNPEYGGYTSLWVSGVPTGGTFVKNVDANWSNTGPGSGIPGGWTIETASA